MPPLEAAWRGSDMANAVMQSKEAGRGVLAGAPGLSRVWGLKELVFYGIILTTPTAPMPVFGIVSQVARGHVVTTILLAMLAMTFTAVSYGRMAAVYPHSGSAYAYVGRELHPSLGYLTGWAIVFEYVLNPLTCVIWCSKAAMNFVPQIPYAGWAVSFAALFTLLNLRGIRGSARTNQWLTYGLGFVLVLFFIAAARWLWISPPLTTGAWWRPFYDPQTFSFKAVSSGASIALLTYIGFDGISTLSEEVRNPRRNILLATVFTCLLTGVLAAAEVYAAQLVWGAEGGFRDPDTAFVEVAGKAGGPALFAIVNLSLLVATVGSGLGAHLAASRLLYGMGQDDAIPKRFFTAVTPRTRIPRNNILLIGGVVLIGAFAVSYQLGVEMLNFGAVIAFMGVNAAAFVRFYIRSPHKSILNAVPPLFGFLICLYILLSLGATAKLAGLFCLLTGFTYGAWRTDWFRRTIAFTALDDGTDAESSKMS
jgi:putrescine importer